MSTAGVWGGGITSFLGGFKSIFPSTLDTLNLGRSIKSGKTGFSSIFCSVLGCSLVGNRLMDFLSSIGVGVVNTCCGGATTTGGTEGMIFFSTGRVPMTMRSAFAFSALESENLRVSVSYILSEILAIGLFSTSNPFSRRYSTTVPIPTFSSFATLINCLSIKSFYTKNNPARSVGKRAAR